MHGEFNRTTAKLASLLGSQEQFVTDASHQLRTPLTALRLSSRTATRTRPCARRPLWTARRRAARARASRRAGPPATDVDLAAVAADRVEQWEPLAAERGVRLSRRATAASCTRGAARLEQVLDNLLSNAIDASPRDALIVVAVHGSELHVIDEGPGLTAEQRARAFDRFWRASNEPGSGLGLAIAKRLVELDDGEIELRAAPRAVASTPSSATAAAASVLDPGLCSVPVATMTRAHAGFTGVVQPEWLRPRGWVAPQRVAAREIDTLPGVGATLAKRLRALGIETVPRSPPAPAAPVRARGRRGRHLAALGRRGGRDRRASSRTSARGASADGGRSSRRASRTPAARSAPSWFNQPWLAEKLTPGTHLRLRGKLGRYGFDVKSYDVGEAQATADFAPVYPASEQVPSTKAAPARLASRSPRSRRYLPDALPAELDEPLACDALAAIHFPRDEARPRRRGGGSRSTSSSRSSSSLRARATRTPSRRAARAGRARRPLPRGAAVRLTEHQERAIAEIDLDLARTIPMQRLLQGDVGSGKTVVALYALLRAVETPVRARSMAPTETLAEQHFRMLEPLCARARRPLRPAHRLVGLKTTAMRSRAASRRSRSARTR